MTYETPEQYELRTMSQAFGGCAKGGGDSWKKAQERKQRFEEKELHWWRMENDAKYREWYLDNLKTFQEAQNNNEFY